MAAQISRLEVLTNTVPAARRALATVAPAASSERAIVASPYLTSGNADPGVAESVIGAGNPALTVVLTTFDALTFAMGGSSLRTLRKLAEMGFDLRSLPGLHAKVVSTEKAQIVGSQNLTLQGTRNREIGVRLVDSGVAAALRKELEGWVSESEPITMRMIEDMERRVAPLLALADRLEQAARKVDTEMKEVAARRSEARLKGARGRRLVRAIRQSVASSEVKPLSYWARPNDRMPTVGRQKSDLTLWHRADGGAGEERLETRDRYLLVAPDGRMGWTALNKECLGAVGVSRRPRATFQFGGLSCDYSRIRFVDVPADGEANVTFDLVEPRSGQEASVRASFVLDGLEGVRVEGSTRLATALRRLWKEKPRGLESALTEVLLKPFRYERNGRGMGIVQFLGARAGQRFSLRLHCLRGQVFFVLEGA